MKILNRKLIVPALAVVTGLLIAKPAAAQNTGDAAANPPAAEATPAAPIVVNVKGDAGVAVV